MFSASRRVPAEIERQRTRRARSPGENATYPTSRSRALAASC